MRGLGLTACAAVLCGAASASTYSYTGAAFSSFTDDPSVSGAFGEGMRVTGSFTTSGPLSATATPVDIRGSIVSYSFSDGRNVFEQSNSLIEAFEVTADGAGRIQDWRIRFGSVPVPSSTDPLEPQAQYLRLITRSSLFGGSGTQVFDQGAVFECQSASPCTSFFQLGRDIGQISSTRGTMTLVTAVPVPAALPLALCGFGALGLFARRRGRGREQGA